LPVPKIIVPADEIRNGKPSPEGFLRAAELLRVPPAECLVFEDTRPGIEAGVNAGMQVVAILTTVPSTRLRYRPLIRDFRDVTIEPEGDHLKVDVRDASSSLASLRALKKRNDEINVKDLYCRHRESPPAGRRGQVDPPMGF
jgi:sugar-phosphatase